MPDTDTRTREILLERSSSLARTHAAAPLSIPGESLPAACANCGEALAGPYCAQCGQHVADFHRSVWRFVVDFFDNTICWDNKFFRTLGPLFRHPGFLTREFMLGRRVRYVHPLRLFLFTSAVCLTLLQYSHRSIIRSDSKPEARNLQRGINVNFGEAASPVPTPDTPAKPAVGSNKDADDAASDGKPGDDSDDPSDRAIKRALTDNLIKAGQAVKDQSDAGDEAFARALKARIKEAGGEERFGRAITDGVQNRLSWVALALLPVFALGLRALYWRQDSFYFEHLIFSLHYHTFLLLFWTVYVAVLGGVSHLPFHSFLGAMARVGLLLPPLYLYVALRRMYGDGPKRTVVKVLLLGSMHLLSIVIGVAAVGAAAYFSTK